MKKDKQILHFQSARLLILLTVVFSSCKKFVEVPPPGNLVVSSYVFSNDQTATAAIAGLYTNLTNGINLFNGYATVYPGLSADELINTSSSADDDAFSNNAIPSNSTIIYTIWANAYSYIYQANAIIEGLNGSSKVTPALKMQLTGEAEYLRAFTYFYLTNYFGDVPLVTSTDYSVNAHLPVAASARIYQQIETDLLNAQTQLNVSYTDIGRIRANKWAVTALLARVYLYEGKWPEAQTQASSVINSGVYSLVNDLNSVFLSTSNEAIWQLQPSESSINTAEGSLFIPGSSTLIPTYRLGTFLQNSFEPADKRKASWTNISNINGQTYTYPYKYKISTSTSLSEYDIVLRLAEQYLIRAEAQAEQNNIADAQTDLNIIRNRAGLSAITSSDKTTLLNAILHENQIEFFAEWGHRWLDLKRLNLADSIFKAEKTGWKSTAILYPIPYSQLLVNTALNQNPGY